MDCIEDKIIMNVELDKSDTVYKLISDEIT